MSWFIQADVNNGYPAQNTWRESWQTSWTSDSSHRYPDYMWRIQAGVNKDYPWIYPWFKESTTDIGDIIIGGSQSNYPSGFSNSDKGGIRDDFDNHTMISTGNTGSNTVSNVIVSALSHKAFVCTGADLYIALAALNDPDIIATSEYDIISKIYGANVFDCFQSCKAFPIDLSMLSSGSGGVISGTVDAIKAFGKYELTDPNVPLLNSIHGYYHFPTIHVEPKQAWEIENIDFSIWLPMSGCYPIEIRGVSDVDVILYVDLLEGTGEYHVHINTQLVGVHRCLLGVDIPLNTNQGKMQANMLTNVVSTVTKAAGSLLGATVGGGIGAYVGGAIGNAINPFTEHYAMTNPAVGGNASMQGFNFVRVIAKIPKMFKSGYGYKELLGWNRSTCYVKLNECSGYTKCKNYKTDIIVATDTEKLEIERLMNGGVFL